jgi:hypothetical protein
MRTETKVNYKIDWSGTSISPFDKIFSEEDIQSGKAHKKIMDDRKHYFQMLRDFLQDLKNLGRDDVDEIFSKYNIHLVDIDDIPRVNIDDPI